MHSRYIRAILAIFLVTGVASASFYISTKISSDKSVSFNAPDSNPLAKEVGEDGPQKSGKTTKPAATKPQVTKKPSKSDEEEIATEKALARSEAKIESSVGLITPTVTAVAGGKVSYSPAEVTPPVTVTTTPSSTPTPTYYSLSTYNPYFAITPTKTPTATPALVVTPIPGSGTFGAAATEEQKNTISYMSIDANVCNDKLGFISGTGCFNGERKVLGNADTQQAYQQYAAQKKQELFSSSNNDYLEASVEKCKIDGKANCVICDPTKKDCSKDVIEGRDFFISKNLILDNTTKNEIVEKQKLNQMMADATDPRLNAQYLTSLYGTADLLKKLENEGVPYAEINRLSAARDAIQKNIAADAATAADQAEKKRFEAENLKLGKLIAGYTDPAISDTKLAEIYCDGSPNKTNCLIKFERKNVLLDIARTDKSLYNYTVTTRQTNLANLIPLVVGSSTLSNIEIDDKTKKEIIKLNEDTTHAFWVYVRENSARQRQQGVTSDQLAKEFNIKIEADPTLLNKNIATYNSTPKAYNMYGSNYQFSKEENPLIVSKYNEIIKSKDIEGLTAGGYPKKYEDLSDKYQEQVFEKACKNNTDLFEACSFIKNPRSRENSNAAKMYNENLAKINAAIKANEKLYVSQVVKDNTILLSTYGSNIIDVNNANVGNADINKAKEVAKTEELKDTLFSPKYGFGNMAGTNVPLPNIVTKNIEAPKILTPEQRQELRDKVATKYLEEQKVIETYTRGAGVAGGVSVALLTTALCSELGPGALVCGGAGGLAAAVTNYVPILGKATAEEIAAEQQRIKNFEVFGKKIFNNDTAAGLVQSLYSNQDAACGTLDGGRIGTSCTSKNNQFALLDSIQNQNQTNSTTVDKLSDPYTQATIAVQPFLLQDFDKLQDEKEKQAYINIVASTGMGVISAGAGSYIANLKLPDPTTLVQKLQVTGINLLSSAANSVVGGVQADIQFDSTSSFVDTQSEIALATCETQYGKNSKNCADYADAVKAETAEAEKNNFIMAIVSDQALDKAINFTTFVAQKASSAISNTPPPATKMALEINPNVPESVARMILKNSGNNFTPAEIDAAIIAYKSPKQVEIYNAEAANIKAEKDIIIERGKSLGLELDRNKTNASLNQEISARENQISNSTGISAENIHALPNEEVKSLASSHEILSNGELVVANIRPNGDVEYRNTNTNEIIISPATSLDATMVREAKGSTIKGSTIKVESQKPSDIKIAVENSSMPVAAPKLGDPKTVYKNPVESKAALIKRGEALGIENPNSLNKDDLWNAIVAKENAIANSIGVSPEVIRGTSNKNVGYYLGSHEVITNKNIVVVAIQENGNVLYRDNVTGAEFTVDSSAPEAMLVKKATDNGFNVIDRNHASITKSLNNNRIQAIAESLANKISSIFTKKATSVPTSSDVTSSAVFSKNKLLAEATGIPIEKINKMTPEQIQNLNGLMALNNPKALKAQAQSFVDNSSDATQVKISSAPNSESVIKVPYISPDVNLNSQLSPKIANDIDISTPGYGQKYFLGIAEAVEVADNFHLQGGFEGSNVTRISLDAEGNNSEVYIFKYKDKEYMIKRPKENAVLDQFGTYNERVLAGDSVTEKIVNANFVNTRGLQLDDGTQIFIQNKVPGKSPSLEEFKAKILPIIESAQANNYIYFHDDHNPNNWIVDPDGEYHLIDTEGVFYGQNNNTRAAAVFVGTDILAENSKPSYNPFDEYKDRDTKPKISAIPIDNNKQSVATTEVKPGSPLVPETPPQTPSADPQPAPPTPPTVARASRGDSTPPPSPRIPNNIVEEIAVLAQRVNELIASYQKPVDVAIRKIDFPEKTNSVNIGRFDGTTDGTVMNVADRQVSSKTPINVKANKDGTITVSVSRDHNKNVLPIYQGKKVQPGQQVTLKPSESISLSPNTKLYNAGPDGSRLITTPTNPRPIVKTVTIKTNIGDTSLINPVIYPGDQHSKSGVVNGNLPPSKIDGEQVYFQVGSFGSTGNPHATLPLSDGPNILPMNATSTALEIITFGTYDASGKFVPLKPELGYANNISYRGGTANESVIVHTNTSYLDDLKSKIKILSVEILPTTTKSKPKTNTSPKSPTPPKTNPIKEVVRQVQAPNKRSLYSEQELLGIIVKKYRPTIDGPSEVNLQYVNNPDLVVEFFGGNSEVMYRSLSTGEIFTADNVSIDAAIMRVAKGLQINYGNKSMHYILGKMWKMMGLPRK